MIVRCTGKLRDLLREPVLTVAASENDWYANTLTFDRHRCLLLTHSGSLFSALVPVPSVQTIRPLGPLLVTAITEQLTSERLPPDTFGILDPASVSVATTVDRRVLGTMNDHAVFCENAVYRAGGFDSCDLSALNRDLHRVINTILDYTPPIEVVDQRARWHQPPDTG